MSLINVSHLTFSYEGSYDNVFEDVSFALDTDWKLGFTGRNGRGKTTFLKLLAGELAHGGAITAGVSFLYFPFAVPDPQAQTRCVFEALAPECPLWQVQRELTLLQVDASVLYRSFCTLSNGEQTKILLAALFLKEGAFLLIDEPTNHLDAAARAIVSSYMNAKRGFILVSHDRAFLDGCIDHVLAINKHNVTVQQGNFSTWLADKERQDELERAQNARLEKDIRRLDEAARRASDWSMRAEKEKHVRNSGLRPDRGYAGHKAAKLMKRAKVTQARQEAAAAEKSKLLRNIEQAQPLRLTPLLWNKSAPLVHAQALSLYYGARCVCGPVSFTLVPGQRIALTGPNGCGKSTILKAVLGEAIRTQGVLLRGAGLKISYVPQDTAFLRGSARDFARTHALDETRFFTLLRKLDFARVQFEKDMADFSAGQKKKVLLAKSLCENAHLYVWDEPLNYIDVLSRMQIETLLAQDAPAMIFVEHDAAFIQKIATCEIALCGQKER